MNLIMTWGDRTDERIVDLIANDQERHRVASVPDGRKDVVLREKATFTAVVAQYTAADGAIDWPSVAVAFQAHVDRLLTR